MAWWDQYGGGNQWLTDILRQLGGGQFTPEQLSAAMPYIQPYGEGLGVFGGNIPDWLGVARQIEDTAGAVGQPGPADAISGIPGPPQSGEIFDPFSGKDLGFSLPQQTGAGGGVSDAQLTAEEHGISSWFPSPKVKGNWLTDFLLPAGLMIGGTVAGGELGPAAGAAGDTAAEGVAAGTSDIGGLSGASGPALGAGAGTAAADLLGPISISEVPGSATATGGTVTQLGQVGPAFSTGAGIGGAQFGASGAPTGGPGGGAAGADVLGGGTFNPTTGIIDQTTANPITGQTGTISDVTSQSSAFNPTTGVTGTPSAAAAPVTGAVPPGTPAGMDPTAAANFAAENTSNPAGTAAIQNVISGSPPASTTGSSIMDLLKGGGSFLARNPGLALGAAGLGTSALIRPNIPNIGNMSNQAAQAQSTADALLPAEQTGRLPPGMQSLVQNALQDTIAGIKSKYANMGLSGSSSEQQEIQAAQERAAAETANLATTVTNQGLNALGLADQIYAAIANIKLQQDSALRNAISSFAGAAGASAGASALRSAVS